jgi:hypothetical protein
MSERRTAYLLLLAMAVCSMLGKSVFETVLAFVFFYEGVTRIGPSRATAFGGEAETAPAGQQLAAD